MLHQLKLIQVFTKPAIVPFVQSDAVIPNRGSSIDLAMQLPVSFGSICLKYKGSHALLIHFLLFCVNIVLSRLPSPPEERGFLGGNYVRQAQADIGSAVDKIKMYDSSLETKKNDYDSLDENGNPPLVDPEENRIEGCMLNVTDDCFFWSFYPKYLNDICTTNHVAVELLDDMELVDRRNEDWEELNA